MTRIHFSKWKKLRSLHRKIYTISLFGSDKIILLIAPQIILWSLRSNTRLKKQMHK